MPCTYSIPPLSSEHTNRSLTIRTTIPIVTRDPEDTSKIKCPLSHIDDFYPKAKWIHVCTDGSATDAVKDGGAGRLIYMPNGQTLEAASSTGKKCTNYDAEVKALEQGAQSVIDQTDTNSEDVVFLTDSPQILDSLAGQGGYNIRHKLNSILEHRRVILKWIPAHSGIKGNAHADRLEKNKKNSQIHSSRKKTNNEEQVQSKEDTR